MKNCLFKNNNFGFVFLLAPYFKSGKHCNTSCPDGSVSDEQLNCIPCNGVCEKSCDFGSTVYNEYNYMSLQTGCTHILGHVILDFGDFNGMLT